MKLLLVIPCYRESSRLPRFLPDLCTAVRDSTRSSGGATVEILPVDDGSGPEEAAWMREFARGLQPDFPFLRPPLLCPENSGKGGAVYAGWAQADETVTHLGFVDADGAIPPAEVIRLTQMIPEDSAAALLSVRTGKAGTTVKRTPLRRLVGGIFRRVVRAQFRFPLPDTQCGFKIVPALAWRESLPDLTERRFCFDVDLIWHLLRGGTPVRAVPIDWTEQPGTRMKPSGAWSMFRSLAVLRRRLGDWRPARENTHSG